MHPPAGRIELGATVRAPGGRQGDVVGERPIESNGAWVYTVRFPDGTTADFYDFELRPASTA